MHRPTYATLWMFGIAVSSAPACSDSEKSPQDAAAETAADSAADHGPGGSEAGAEAGDSGAAPDGGTNPGEGRIDKRGIAQVWVPPGSFKMGTDDATIAAIVAQKPPAWVLSELPSEQPEHEVRISAGFWLDKTEVTNEAFDKFVADGAYDKKELWSDAGWAWLGMQVKTALPRKCAISATPTSPRICVTWYEAEAHARWRGGRLPSEAEWEFAARGPESRQYPWGNEFDAARAHVVGAKAPAEVGSYPAGASWIGALDLSGNAMEWVQDWLDVDYYKTSPATDPPGPATGTIKIEKGGFWGANAFVARAAYRHYEDPPTYQDKHIGFRVVTSE